MTVEEDVNEITICVEVTEGILKREISVNVQIMKNDQSENNVEIMNSDQSENIGILELEQSKNVDIMKSDRTKLFLHDFIVYISPILSRSNDSSLPYHHG